MNIFISYKSEDRAIAREIKKRIEQDTGASCWMDEASLHHSEYFTTVIKAAIDECDRVILVISPKTSKSKYIYRETHYAEEQHKDITPIEIEEGVKTDWLQFFFAGQHSIFYNVPESFDGFINDLAIQYPIEPENTLVQTNVLEFLQKGWTFLSKGNYDLAVDFFLQAAQKGNGDAQYQLGLCYLSNKGVNHNTEEAFRWFKESANQNCVLAMVALAKCYARGNGTVKNEPLAFRWFMKAAKQNNVNAMFNVGRCFETGKGIEKNIHEARIWYQKAARLGDELSLECLNRLTI